MPIKIDYNKFSDQQLDRIAAGELADDVYLETLSDSELDKIADGSDYVYDPDERAPTELITEKMADIDTTDRLIIKNFGGDLNSSLEYFRKKYPEKEVITDEDGSRILFRDKADENYKVLDPDTGIFSTDILRDIGDIGYDVGAGIVETGATIAGGVAGAPTVFGALPAAAAAGGATSATLETLRQGIGKGLGVRDEMSGGDIALAGGLGALSPILFGTGAKVAKPGAKGFIADKLPKVEEALNKYFRVDAPNPPRALKTIGDIEPGPGELKSLAEITSELEMKQKGLIGRGISKYREGLAPHAGEFVSGVDADVIKTAKENLPLIKKLSDEDNLIEFIDDATEKIVDRVDDVKSTVGQNIEKEVTDLTNMGFSVDIKDAYDELAKVYARANRLSKEGGAKFLSSSAKESSKLLDDIGLGRTKTVTERLGSGDRSKEILVSPEIAWELKQYLSEIGKMHKVRDVGATFPDGTPLSSKRLMSSARRASGKITDALNRLPTSRLKDLNRDYSKIIGAESDLVKVFGDNANTYSKLKSLANISNLNRIQDMKEADKIFGTDIVDFGRLIKAVDSFAKPSWFAISNKGSVNTARTAGLGFLGGMAGSYLIPGNMGFMLGSTLGGAAGGPKAVKKYMQMGRLGSKASRGMKPLPQVAGQSAWNYVTSADYKKEK